MTTIFGPLHPHELPGLLSQCAAIAAKKKGLNASGWYSPQELHDYLEKHSPSTFKLFMEFAEAFAAHTDLNWKAQGIEGRQPSPADLAELKVRFEKYDAARKTLLADLGE